MKIIKKSIISFIFIIFSSAILLPAQAHATVPLIKKLILEQTDNRGVPHTNFMGKPIKVITIFDKIEKYVNEKKPFKTKYLIPLILYYRTPNAPEVQPTDTKHYVSQQKISNNDYLIVKNWSRTKTITDFYNYQKADKPLALLIYKILKEYPKVRKNINYQGPHYETALYVAAALGMPHVVDVILKDPYTNAAISAIPEQRFHHDPGRSWLFDPPPNVVVCYDVAYPINVFARFNTTLTIFTKSIRHLLYMETMYHLNRTYWHGRVVLTKGSIYDWGKNVYQNCWPNQKIYVKGHYQINNPKYNPYYKFKNPLKK